MVTISANLLTLLSATGNMYTVGYDAKICEHVEAEYLNIKCHKHCSIILDNIDYFRDFIIKDKFKHINYIVDILNVIDFSLMKKLISIYSISTIYKLVNYGLHNLAADVRISDKKYKKINIVYTKFGKDKYFRQFISSIEDIDRINQSNISELYSMFSILYSDEVKCFHKWGPGNNGNPGKNILQHYNKHVLDPRENWQYYLKNRTVEEYSRFAIEISAIMTSKTIHSHGSRVYFSGLFGKIIIIGRLDSEYGLGISSCYIISDENFAKKISTIEKNTCFKFM